MNPRAHRWSASALRASLTLSAAVLLASCGGGGADSQSEQFAPTQMVVFGDEFSLLLPPSSANAIDAKKYSVNGFTAGTTPAFSIPDCRVNPLWVQLLARNYGLVFAQCNPDNLPVTARMLAANGAKVSDVVSALTTYLAGASFTKRDLVTVMVGNHDVLELYEAIRSGAVTEDAAVTEIERRGELLASQFDRIVNDNNTGGRALYVPIPDLSISPFANASEDGRAERVRLLRKLTDGFNTKLRTKITNNGRSIGLVDAYQLYRNIYDNLGLSGFENVTQAACTTASILDCTSKTLQPATATEDAASEVTWLWADSTHVGAGGQIVLGNRALDIATNNPF